MSDKIRVGMLNPKNVGEFAGLLPYDYVPDDKSTVLLGAMVNEFAAGVLWGEFTSDDCEIMQLAVHPAFRRHGVGKKLVEEFLSAFWRTERLVPVHMSFVQDDKNMDLYRFLSDTDLFTFFEQGSMSRINGSLRKSSEWYRRMKNREPGDEKIVPFFSLPLADRRKFVEENEPESISFPSELLTDGDLYEEKLSLCCVKDEKVEAAIFVRTDGEMLHVTYLHGSDNQKIMRQLLAAAITEADRYYPRMDIQAEAVVPSARRMINHLAGGKAEEYPVIMASWNFTNAKKE